MTERLSLFHTYTHIWSTMEYYSAIKRMKFFPFAATWMNLGGHYAKQNKSETGKYCVISLRRGVKKIQQT